MARKKMKLNLNDVFNMFDIDSCRRVHHNYDRNIKGYRVRLSKKLTQEQRDYILSFKNTEIGSCHLAYAPEIKYDTVIILDKCIKKNEVK